MPIPMLGAGNIALIDRLLQIPDALWERRRVSGDNVWPPAHPAWAEGTVTSVTAVPGTNDYRVDCGTGNGWFAFLNGAFVPKWVGYQPPEGLPGIPTSYDLVIVRDPRKWWQTVRGPIVSQEPAVYEGEPGPTAHQYVTITGTQSGAAWGTAVQHAIAGGYLSGLPALSGASWYIIKRGGLSPSDRQPERPNMREAERGNCVGGQAYYPSEPAEATLYSFAQNTDDDRKWAADKWVGYQAMVFDGARVLHRVTIQRSDATRIYFAPASWQASGQFSIVESGFECVPDRRVWQPAQHYYGKGDAFYTHMPDDNGVRTGAVLAADKVYWSEMQENDTCESVPHPPGGSALDLDLVIHERDYAAECDSGRTDDFPSPHLHKSIRHWQKTMLDTGSRFVMTPPTGTQAAKMYHAAELCRALGVPSGTSAIYRHADGNPAFNVISAVAQAVGSVYYVVYDKDGTAKSVGVSGCADGIARPGDNIYTPLDTTNGTDVGLSVVWSVGLRRYYERRVRYLEPRTCFRPDTVPDGLGGRRVADPPEPEKVYDEDGVWTGDYTGEGTGRWLHRTKSTHYAEYDEYGAISDIGPAFVTGELVSVEGDNSSGPSIPERVPADSPPDSEARLLLPYYDLFFRGTYAEPIESRYRGGRTGVSTGGASGRLQDTTKDWWSDGVNGGALVTHSYPVAAGGANSVTLAINVNDHTVKDGKWFGPDRFTGLIGGIFSGFVVEFDRAETIDDPENPGTPITRPIVRKFIITNCVIGGGQIVVNFTGEPGFTAAAGEVMRIREPRYTLNKFEDRDITLTSPNGVRYTATITHSADDTLWINNARGVDVELVGPLVIGAGWSYAIAYTAPGTVLRRTPGGWEIPTGLDSARLGVDTPQPFVANPNNNLPTMVKTYGLHRRGDVVLDFEMIAELHDGINLLSDSIRPMGWTNRDEENALFSRLLTDYDFRYDTEPPNASLQPPSESVPYSSFSDSFDALWNNGFAITNSSRQLSKLNDRRPRSYSANAFSMTYRRGGASSLSIDPSAVGNYDGVLDSSFAYAKVNATPGDAVLPISITGYIFCGISPSNPDNTNVIDGIERHRFFGSEYGGYIDFVTETANKFGANGTAALFRQWSSFSTWGPSVVDGYYLGSKLGGLLSQEKPNLEFGDYSSPDNSAELRHLEGVAGWCVIDELAIIKWDFVYRNGTW